MSKSKNHSMKQRAIPLFITLALIISLFSGIIVPASAATLSLGNVTNAYVNGNQLILTIDNGTEPADDILTLEVCKENILRVNYQPNSVESSPRTPMIDPALSWDVVPVTIDTSSDPIRILTSGMQIDIARTPCRMTVKKADGSTLFWEPASGGVFHDGVRFVRAESSNIYGIHSFDCFDNEGNLLRNDNTTPATAGQQGNSGGPFMWSTAGYGILVDSDGGYPYTNSVDKKMEFYYGGTPVEGRRYYKDNVEYYVMLGEPKEIISGYSKITGTSPMMPKWSLGFSNFEWNVNEWELNQMVDTYRAKNIPLDSYAFDYDWKRYGEDNYGEFNWNTNNFPSAATTLLKQSMDAKGVKMIGITKPRIVTKLSDGRSTIQGLTAAINNFFYPGHYEYTDYFMPVTVQSIDPYNADQRNWWWENSQDSFDKGIVGWWNDESDKVSSGSAQYWFGNFTTLHLSQGIYEGQREYTNGNTRVWQTARNYYPGTQRYGTSIWSGDVGTQFYKGERVDWAAGLNEQKASLLSTINNGQPKWGSDGGGFNQNSGNTENPSPELYTRWLQLAAVSPVFRVHGNYNHQRQPWYYGYTAEEVVKSAIQLRYSLIPYMYSYEREAYESGLGLVRPLLFDYPNDPNVADYSDAWMFGDWLLVAPVTERGQTSTWIYLPEGTWVDYNRGIEYTGGRYIPYMLDSESWSDLPMFVKAGAIIPSQEVYDYVDQRITEKLFVDMFPSNQLTSFRYYDDDGDTYNYETGDYYSQVLSSQKTGGSVNINIAAKTGNYRDQVNYYYLAVHGQAATGVIENGVSLQKYNDLDALLDAPGAGWTASKDVYGDVTYVKVAAGSNADKAISVTGNAPVQLSEQKHQAEYGSLSGTTVAQRASVNSNHPGYSGTGFVDNLEADQAAVTFYTKVTNAGDYDVAIRYPNGDPSTKTLSVYVNGSFCGQAYFPSTGSWSVWADTTMTLPLTAGNNSITLKYDATAGDTGYVNIDYISVPFTPNVITVEAESAALWGAAKANYDHWFYSGSGFVDSMVSTGAKTEFEVYLPQNGTYSTEIRYCNGTQSTKNLNLYVNDVFWGVVDFPSFGANWNEWLTVTKQLPLSAGRNIISLRFESGNTGNINLDKLTVSLGGVAYRQNLLDNGSFDRPLAFNSNWTEWHPVGQTLAYGIDSGSGTNPPESPVEGDKRAYFHSNGAYQQSIHQGVSVANGTYKLEAWVKVSNTTPSTARLEVSGYGGQDIFTNMPSSGSGWRRITIENITVSSGYIDIGFYCASSGGTTIHIDAVKLYHT